MSQWEKQTAGSRHHHQSVNKHVISWLQILVTSPVPFVFIFLLALVTSVIFLLHHTHRVEWCWRRQQTHKSSRWCLSHSINTVSIWFTAVYQSAERGTRSPASRNHPRFYTVKIGGLCRCLQSCFSCSSGQGVALVIWCFFCFILMIIQLILRQQEVMIISCTMSLLLWTLEREQGLAAPSLHIKNTSVYAPRSPTRLSSEDLSDHYSFEKDLRYHAKYN